MFSSPDFHFVAGVMALGVVALVVAVADRSPKRRSTKFGLGLLACAGIGLYFGTIGRPNPTLIDQIDAERVWVIEPIRVPDLSGPSWSMHEIAFAPDTSRGQPEPGTLIAFKDFGFDWGHSQALEHLRDDEVPPAGTYVGADQPTFAARLNEDGTAFVAVSPSESHWSHPSIVLCNRPNAPFDQDKVLYRALKGPQSPAWWPTRGDVARNEVFGKIVPGRNAVYYWGKCTYKGRATGGFTLTLGGARSGPVFGPPYELVIEDRSTSEPRLVAFRFENHGTFRTAPRSLVISADGRWGFLHNSTDNLIWFLPLHEVWDHFATTQPTSERTD